MKTQRRHKLETNQLAAWFGDVVERARPHANLIATGGVVVLVALLASNFLARRSKARDAAAWTALTTASTSSELAAVSNDFPGSPAGAWGTLRAADREFARGMQGLFIDREGALVNLRSAQRAYEELAGNSPDSPLVAQRATFGLAKSYEALGEIEEAIQAYQSLLDVDRFPDGLFADQAKARIESLKDPETGEFYAWFEKQSPAASSDTPATETSPTPEQSGPSGELNQILDNLNPSLPSTEENASDDKSTQPDPDQAPDGETTPREGPEAASEKEPTAPAESTAKDAAPEPDPSPSPETVPSSDAPVPEAEEAPPSEEKTAPSSDES